MNIDEEPKKNTVETEGDSPVEDNVKAAGTPFGIVQNGQRVYFDIDILGGIVVKDSTGTPILKLNENAFITVFNKAFAASSNQERGAFGSDWFMMYCEIDSGVNSNPVGVLEAPNTNRILIKKSGPTYGMMMRIIGGSASDETAAGLVDFNYPIAVGVYDNPPQVPTDIGHGTNYHVQGQIYFDSALGKLRVCTVSGSPGTWVNLH